MKEKTKYSDLELKEFETLILEKLDKAKEELKLLRGSITRNMEGSGDNFSSVKTLEDGANTAEKRVFSPAGRKTT